MYSIVDGIFVGKAAGDTGLAAINIAWPIPALITALGIGIGTGGSVLYSHYRGRGEQKVCENLFELTMTLLIGTGILATILLSLVQKPFLEILGAAGSVQTEAIKYTAIIIAGSILQVAGTGIMPLLRNMNQSLGAMLSMAAGFAVNILVNYYLMFRLNMGIKGAAFGTVTAQAVVVMAGCAILWKTGYRKWRPLWHGQYAADIFKIGITAFGTDMYWHFKIGDENGVVERGVALHKMIRLLTASTINGGYLNFMGNEFGHPEWIDFPREGNGWSYKYARRQWNLVDNPDLCYHYLGDFDEAMVKLIRSVKNIQKSDVIEVWHNDGDQILAYRRKDLVFVFNFNPTRSFTDYGFLVPRGAYDVVLNTDNKQFGGFGFSDDSLRHFTCADPLYAKDKKEWLKLYVPARSAVVLKRVKD